MPPVIRPDTLGSTPIRHFMSPAEAAFIKAIAASPADDAPRLVFADWLDDNCMYKRAKIQRNIVQMMREATGIWRNKYSNLVYMVTRKALWIIKEDGRINMAPITVAQKLDRTVLTHTLVTGMSISSNYEKLR